MLKEINFSTFTSYVITVRDLIAAGFVHSNEFYGSTRELRKSKVFTTSFAGATQMRITCSESDYEEVMDVKNKVMQQIEERRNVQLNAQ